MSDPMGMFGQALAWYLVMQVMGLLALPLAWRLLHNLPDRGYGLSKVLGVLLTGYLLWLGYSFGLLRYEPGSAWLAVLVMGALSVAVGWPLLRGWWARRAMSAGESAPHSGGDGGLEPDAANTETSRDGEHGGLQTRPTNAAGGKPEAQGGPDWRYIVLVELVFLAAFVAWAYVRAHDPAANHTEKPMDLMFMNAIRASAVYPPMDAWLAGHPISYYYFGYWLLTTVGMLAGQPPAIAYNLGQAGWYGLLLSGCFALGYNLVVALRRGVRAGFAGGFLAALLVGISANIQGLLEWLYANGVPVGPVAALLNVRGFPQEAMVTNNWFIDFGWWWWRSSRVVQDLDLAGNHIEVIDEFPAFSYILGDNHPHVLAMPFVLLAIGLALNLFLNRAPESGAHGWRRLVAAMPLGWIGWLVTAVSIGALLFLNTWDLPPYWLLTVLALLAVLLRRPAGEPAPGVWPALGWAALGGILLAVAAALLYVPYLLTAQSQAGGFIPNLFNPTRVGQFVAMFGVALLLLLSLVVLAWLDWKPRLRPLLVSLALVYGLPVLFLASSTVLAVSTEPGRDLLGGMPLPPDYPSYLAAITARWTVQGWTFVLAGGLLAVVAALAWTRLVAAPAAAAAPDSGVPEPGAPEPGDPASAAPDPHRPMPAALGFVLLLAGIGLLLVYAPEFVFLRDNFGTRMNTIFKFYYQAWLLFGLAGAVTIVVALRSWRGVRLAPALLSTLALVLALGSALFLAAGAYSKTNGFAGTPSFDATAYLRNAGPDELAAVEWVLANTAPDARIVEAKGQPYNADTARISTMTGRPTLLGWDGHEAQWRGKAYGQMAAGRSEALEALYRSVAVDQVKQIVDQWEIDYVYLGPAERSQYGVSPVTEGVLAQAMDKVFESGGVRIYRAR